MEIIELRCKRDNGDVLLVEHTDDGIVITTLIDGEAVGYINLSDDDAKYLIERLQQILENPQ